MTKDTKLRIQGKGKTKGTQINERGFVKSISK